MTTLTAIPNKLLINNAQLNVNTSIQTVKLINSCPSPVIITGAAIKEDDSIFSVANKTYPITIDGAAFTKTTAISIGGTIEHLLKYNTYLIAVLSTGVVNVYSVDTSGVLTFVNSTYISGLTIKAAVVIGNYVVAACGTNGIQSFKIESDLSITLVHTAVPTGDIVNHITEHNGILYVSSDLNGLSIWKINVLTGTFIYVSNDKQSGTCGKTYVDDDVIISKYTGSGLHVYSYEGTTLTHQYFFSVVMADFTVMPELDAVITCYGHEVKLYTLNNYQFTLKDTAVYSETFHTIMNDGKLCFSYSSYFAHIYRAFAVTSDYQLDSVTYIGGGTHTLHSFMRFSEEFAFFSEVSVGILRVTSTSIWQTVLAITANPQEPGLTEGTLVITSNASPNNLEIPLAVNCVSKNAFGLDDLNYRQHSSDLILSQYKE